MATDTQKEHIVGLVVGMFNAAPGETFLGEFENAIDAGVSFKQLADILEATPQFQNDILGGDNSVANQVAVLMDHFGLTPGNTDPASPDAQAEVFFNELLNQGATFGDAVIAAGLYLLGNPAEEFADVAALFQNKILVARLYSEENSDDNVADLQAVLTDVTAEEPATEEAAIAYLVAHGFVPPEGEPGETFALTLNQDNFVGTVNNDTFNAPAAQDFQANLKNTLQNVDVLDGSEGTDTLNATLVEAGIAVAPTLKNIENVNVRFADGAGTASLNLANATGVNIVTVAESTNDGTVTNVGNAAVGVANQNQHVNINGSTATALNLNLNTVGTKDTDITVDLGSATANAATSFVITANDAHVTFIETVAGAATTSASVAATGSNEITFAAADLTSLTSLTVTGTGDVDFTGAAMTGLKTLTAGDGGVKVDATGGVLETATTGAGEDVITAEGATVKNISTGAGNDTVTVVASDLAAAATVDLGAGDDTLTFATPFEAGATLTGGDGTDTLGFDKATYAAVSAYGATDLAKVTGFEMLSISDTLITGDIIDVSKIAGIVSFKAAAGINTGESATVTKLGATTTVELAGAAANDGALNVTLNADTAADTMTLILNKDYADNNDATVDDTSAAHTVVAAEVETINVNSTANQTVDFTPVDGYKADTVTNTLVLDGSNNLVDLVISGDQKLIFTSTAAMDKLATIDASANTAGVEIDASAALATSPALTINGTAMADVISGGLKGDTITLGGGNDILDYTKGASKIGTGAFDTITDFSANTFGNGTNGAAGTGAIIDATKWTGDVLRFFGDGDLGGAVVDVFTNASDATTFLANNAGSAADLVAALDSSTGNLYVDNTGNLGKNDGVADFFIQLTGVTTIDAAAFQVVVV